MRSAHRFIATILVLVSATISSAYSGGARPGKPAAISAAKKTSTIRDAQTPGEERRGIFTQKTKADRSHQQERFLQQNALSEELVFESTGPFLGQFGSDNHDIMYGPQLIADVNNDGIPDIVVFGEDGVNVATGKGDGTFLNNVLALENEYTYNNGWRVESHPRLLADVNGDGSADIVGFGNDGVNLAFGKTDGTFAPRESSLDEFGVKNGWRIEEHPRMMADVNGDGKADIIGFGGHGIRIALGTDDGFNHLGTVLEEFNTEGGWSDGNHPRMVADVNGDGKADIVGFGKAGVYVALGKEDGTFNYMGLVLETYGSNYGEGGPGGWQVDKNPRMMADVNGDGRADIVGFGNGDVYVHLGKKDGTFIKKGTSLSGGLFNYNKGWEVEQHPRMMADVNGDGRADIVGFFNDGVYVALGTLKGGFDYLGLVLIAFANNPAAGAWQDNNLRMMADLNLDGRADIVGFKDDGVYDALILISPLAICRQSTLELDQSIHSEYDQSGATITDIAAPAEEGAPMRILFVDFSTNTEVFLSAQYENACNQEGGHIEEVTYEAICMSNREQVVLYVKEQPRCYHDICGTDAATEAALLEEFAIKPTQNLASDMEPWGNWKCNGTLRDDVPSACDYQSNEISLLDEVAVHSLLREPTVENKKFLWLFPTDTYIVDFPKSNELKDACQGIGTYQELATFKVDCTKTTKGGATFEVNGFDACLGGACTGSADDAAGQILKELLQAGEVESDAVCEVSGTAILKKGTTVVALTLSSLWLLL